MSWIEIRIDTTYEAVDWLRTLLAEAAYEGTVHLQAGYPDRIHQPQSGDVQSWVLTACLYLTQDRRSRHQVEKITYQLASLERTGLIATPQVMVVDEKPKTLDTVDLSRQRITEKLVIVGADSLYCSPTSEEVVIRLQPTLAFGTGLHPATLLSLRLLERLVRPSMHTLDLGSGSGILTVAMAKLGAQVVAIDNDDLAVQATQAAVQLNNVCSQVTVVAGSLGRGSELGHWMGGRVSEQGTQLQPTANFDLIMANLFARIHLALARDYRQALKQGNDRPGTLVVAGFTDDRLDDINAAFAAVGLEAYDQESLQEWVALAYRLS